MSGFLKVHGQMGTATTKLFALFPNPDLGSMPPTDNVKAFFLGGQPPILIALSRASSDYIILNAGPKVFLELLVDTFESVAR